MKFHDNVTSKKAMSGIAATGGTTAAQVKRLNVFRITISSSDNISAVMENYRSRYDVEYVEPNIEYKALLTPDDPYFTDNREWKDMMNLREAWDISTGQFPVVVAVLDSGIDINHPDLAQNIWANELEISSTGVDNDSNGFIDDKNGWDFVLNRNNVNDVEGHGTHMAGIIGAVVNNGVGVAGVCSAAKLMAVKVLDENGIGTTYSIASGIIYAADNGAEILNLAFGADTESLVIKEAVEYAGEKGCLMIAAAGNSAADSVKYPAAFSEVMSVGALDKTGGIASYSNYGSGIEIWAPGGTWDSKIYSTVPTYYSAGLYDELDYAGLYGTSQSCAFASGAASLLMSACAGVSIGEIRGILNATAVSGKLNTFNALKTTNAGVFISAAKNYVYPNPVRKGQTPTFRIDLKARADKIKFRLFTLTGEEIYGDDSNPSPTYVDNYYTYRFNCDMGKFANGVYFYLFNAESLGETMHTSGKMALIK
ncbi:MAG: S8 family serine peptidase [Elusimicrobia bacterium]|nr:S8 family serine peptidase [Elusimicrobiota bacterium]